MIIRINAADAKLWYVTGLIFRRILLTPSLLRRRGAINLRHSYSSSSRSCFNAPTIGSSNLSLTNVRDFFMVSYKFCEWWAELIIGVHEPFSRFALQQYLIAVGAQQIQFLGCFAAVSCGCDEATERPDLPFLFSTVRRRCCTSGYFYPS